MALSEDLRLRVVKMVEAGASRRAAGRHFGVSARTAIRVVKNFETHGHVADKPRNKRKRRLDPYREEIVAWVETGPDMTLQEISHRLEALHGIKAPVSTVDDWLKAEGFSFKKNRARGRTGARGRAQGPRGVAAQARLACGPS